MLFRSPSIFSEGNIIYIRKPEDIPAKIAELGMTAPTVIGLESDTLSYNEYVRMAALFPEAKQINSNLLIRRARAVKTHYEIEKMKESGRKHAAVYAHVESVFKEGMTDDELSIELEYISRRLGNLGLYRIFGTSMEIFMGSVLAGPNADNPSPYDFSMGGEGMDASLPVGANGTLLRPGMSLMIDMGGNFNGYQTDMTRVFSIRQLTNQLALDAHQLSIDIQEEVKRMARPGVAVKDLYEMAMEKVKEHNMEHYFMGHRQKAGFIGHGVGIEINELPVISARSKDVLEEGMTFALEPKFVIPGVGAVGIENTFLVTADGLEALTVFDEEIKELI